MFHSEHAEGSNAWYNDLEAWMRSHGEYVTDETINAHRIRIVQERGIWIGDDYRFLAEIDAQIKKKAGQ